MRTDDLRETNVRRPDPARSVVLCVLVFSGLVGSFVLGRISAGGATGAASPVGQSASSQATELQSAINTAAQAEETRQTEKKIKALKDENAELARDKKELQGKLSIAADAVNKMQITLSAEKRRAEEAEWQVRQDQAALSTGRTP